MRDGSAGRILAYVPEVMRGGNAQSRALPGWVNEGGGVVGAQEERWVVTFILLRS